MARVYLKPGDCIDALCELKVKTNAKTQQFSMLRVSEAAEDFTFCIYVGEHHYALRYAFDVSGENHGRLYYDNEDPLD